MPRVSRNVFAGVPHHVTQRGNRREDIFFTEEDRRVYLAWLKQYCDKHEVDVLAYCLMNNHVHIIAVPASRESLQAALKPLHMRYAQRINRRQGWRGHLWQGRFFSSPLDEPYLWAAIRYVERNPVRAKMVSEAERYAWSSAAAHCKSRKDALLTTNRAWREQLAQVADWSAWLAEGDESEKLDVLRRNITQGMPCGSDRFIQRLERTAGRTLAYRPPGRPKKTE